MDSLAAVVHSIPAKTTFRGTTDIAENFTQHTTRRENGELRNALRGRTLIGREVILPPNYALACASFMRAPELSPSAAGGKQSLALAQTVAESSAVGITAVADRYFLWEHDRTPERSDTLSQWIELSHALHMS